MRIGIDARELLGKPTGVGRYLARLLDRWRALPEATAHTFVLYLPAAPEDRLGAWLDDTQVQVRVSPGGGGTLWEQWNLPRATMPDAVDVFFSPAYTAPLLLSVPTVVTIHDVSFAAHPEWFSWRDGFRRRFLTRASARRAQVVLTDSDFSRREIVERLGVQPSRVRTIAPGVDRRSVAPGPRSPLVLYVGSILNRRHVLDLVRAFGKLVSDWPEGQLVIAGDNRTRPFEDPSALARQLGIGQRVRVASYISESELDELYARAKLFVFLSEYEGFGLPPIEALSAGIPVVLGDTAVARETCGDAALYVPIGNLDATVTAMRRLLFDEAERIGLLARADRVLSAYSWTGAARKTLAVLEEAGAAAKDTSS